MTPHNASLLKRRCSARLVDAEVISGRSHLQAEQHSARVLLGAVGYEPSSSIRSSSSTPSWSKTRRRPPPWTWRGWCIEWSESISLTGSIFTRVPEQDRASLEPLIRLRLHGARGNRSRRAASLTPERSEPAGQFSMNPVQLNSLIVATASAAIAAGGAVQAVPPRSPAPVRGVRRRVEEALHASLKDGRPDGLLLFNASI